MRQLPFSKVHIVIRFHQISFFPPLEIFSSVFLSGRIFRIWVYSSGLWQHAALYRGALPLTHPTWPSAFSLTPPDRAVPNHSLPSGAANLRSEPPSYHRRYKPGTPFAGSGFATFAHATHLLSYQPRQMIYFMEKSYWFSIRK